MKVQEIQDRATQVPFRAFAIETTGGSWIDIEKPEQIFLPVPRPDIAIVFEKGGKIYILGIDQIAALEVR